ncbi:MAG: hypothetical protein UR43_C0010G0001, partial [candidate division TM6 bacterium GW2011_GWF2_33_332]
IINSPDSISVGGWQVFANSIISEKSLCPFGNFFSILFHSGIPVAPVVNTLLLKVVAFRGGTKQFVVNKTGPLKLSNSSN